MKGAIRWLPAEDLLLFGTRDRDAALRERGLRFASACWTHLMGCVGNFHATLLEGVQPMSARIGFVNPDSCLPTWNPTCGQQDTSM